MSFWKLAGRIFKYFVKKPAQLVISFGSFAADTTQHFLTAYGNSSLVIIMIDSFAVLSEGKLKTPGMIYTLGLGSFAILVEVNHKLFRLVPKDLISKLELSQYPAISSTATSCKPTFNRVYQLFDALDWLLRHTRGTVVKANYDIALTLRLFFHIFRGLPISDTAALALAAIASTPVGLFDVFYSDLPPMITDEQILKIGHMIDPNAIKKPKQGLTERAILYVLSLPRKALIKLLPKLQNPLNYLDPKILKLYLSIRQATEATVSLANLSLIFTMSAQADPIMASVITTLLSFTIFGVTLPASYVSNRLPPPDCVTPENGKLSAYKTTFGYVINSLCIAAPIKSLQTFASVSIGGLFLFTNTTQDSDVPIVIVISAAAVAILTATRSGSLVVMSGVDSVIKIYNVAHGKDPESLAVVQWLQRLLLLNNGGQETETPTTVVIRIESASGKEMQKVKPTYAQLKEPLITDNSEEEYYQSDNESNKSSDAGNSSEPEEPSFEAEDPEGPPDQGYQPPPM